MRVKIKTTAFWMGASSISKIDFQAQIGGTMEALGVIADEKAPARQSAPSAARPTTVSTYTMGRCPQKAIGSVIENVAHRILRHGP